MQEGGHDEVRRERSERTYLYTRFDAKHTTPPRIACSQQVHAQSIGGPPFFLTRAAERVRKTRGFEPRGAHVMLKRVGDPQWLEIQRAAFGLRMDAAGRFWRHDQRFEHPRIVAFLRCHLEMRGAQCVVQVGEQWVPLELADTPLRVLRLRTQDRDPQLLVSLDDGRLEVGASIQSLRCDDQERISCLVPSASHASTLRARLGNAALMQLSEHIEGLEDAVPTWRFSQSGLTPVRLENFYSNEA